jgi:ADP-ribose pyrophosphatase YjhB (NUDIX family)
MTTDAAMLTRTYTSAEWQQIEQTYQALQRLGQVVDTQLEMTGMAQAFEDFRQWLDQNPRESFAQIKLLQDDQEQAQAYQALSAALARFVLAFETTYADVNKRLEQEIAGMQGQPFVQFDDQGNIQEYTWFNLSYDISDKLNKLATVILGWGQLMVADGAVSKDEFLFLVDKLEPTFRVWNSYQQYVRHIAAPRSIRDEDIADNREDRTQPRLSYDEFLVPYRNALAARDAAGQESEEEYVALVDAEGNYIRAVPRSERKEKALGEFTQGAVIIVADEEGNVLMQQRSKGTMEGYADLGPMDWTIGGYRSQEDVNIEWTALREGQEETGGIISFKKSNLVLIDQRPVNADTDERWVRSTFIHVVSASDKDNIQKRMIDNWQQTEEVDGWEWWGQEDFSAEAKAGEKWSTVNDLLRDIPDFPSVVQAAVADVLLRRENQIVYTQQEWQQVERTYQTLQGIALNVQGRLQQTGMSDLFERIGAFLQENPQQAFEQLSALPTLQEQERVYAEWNDEMQGFVFELKMTYNEMMKEINAQAARINGQTFVQFGEQGALDVLTATDLIFDIKDKMGKITTNITSWWGALSSEGILPRDQFLLMVGQFEYAHTAFERYRDYLRHVLEPTRMTDDDIRDNKEELSHPRQSYDQFLRAYRDALLASGEADQDAAMLEQGQADVPDPARDIVSRQDIGAVVNEVFDRKQVLTDDAETRDRLIDQIHQFQLEAGRSVLVVGPGSQDFLPVVLARLGVNVSTIEPSARARQDQDALQKLFGVDADIRSLDSYDAIQGEQFDYVFMLGVLHNVMTLEEYDESFRILRERPEYYPSFHARMQTLIRSFLKPVLAAVHAERGRLYISDIEEWMEAMPDIAPIIEQYEDLGFQLISNPDIAIDDFSLFPGNFKEGRRGFVFDVVQTGNASEQPSDQDAAMLGRESSENVGGIDLNPANMNLRIRRDDLGQPLPFSAQPVEDIRIEGLVPVIINITPITNLPLLLGAADAAAPEKITSL